jgi:adenylate cyclase, class 2
MQHIEFKAELRHLAAAQEQCKAIGAAHVGLLRQQDTYFKLADGRLKRRETEGQPVQWVFYHRLNDVRPRPCHFTVLTDAQARRRWGAHSLREWLRVSKRRDLWTIEDVEVCLDDVERLGLFVEFKAPVSADFDASECQMALAELRQIFAPVLGEPVAMSYSDLMAQQLGEDAARTT